VVKDKQDSRVISNEFKHKLTGIYQEAPQSEYENNLRGTAKGYSLMANIVE